MLRTIFISLMCVMLITACSKKTKENLGLVTAPPDEFVVLSNPPLNVPPEFNLRAPEDATSAFQRDNARKRAANTLLGSTSAEKNEGSTSSGESVLLKRAGVNTTDPSIRTDLIREQQTEKEEKKKRSLLKKVNVKLSGQGKEPIIDPNLEQKRIKENTDAGKPITEGETPTIDEKKKSVLQRLFN